MIKAFSNIYELAVDRELITPEICHQNDFYGHGTIIKKFIGWQNDVPLPFAIEHGAFADNFVWDVDVNSPVPAILCGPKRRIKVLQNRTTKFVDAIGPIIQYAFNLLSDEEIYNERKRLGRNLLVFPAHSTHHVISKYDINCFIDSIKKLSGNFDTVRVCLYWKDILIGVGKYYEKAGFECVTAGHMYDPQFLNRLKSLLTISDCTMSNANGSFVGMSILLNKPYFFNKQAVYLDAKSIEIINRDTTNVEFYDNDGNTIDTLFSNIDKQITDKQIKFADAHWGTSINKTKSDIISIIDCIFKFNSKNYENIHEIKKYFYDEYLPSAVKSMSGADYCKCPKLFNATHAREGGDNMLKSTFLCTSNFYGKVMLTPETLASIATAPETWTEMLSFHHKLATDDYVKYVDAYYREAINRFGNHWKYLDISNVLFAASRTLQPKTYLEIGVRRGRSACMVVRGCPSVNIVAFDMWAKDYAGMENPGENFVRQELKEHGHSGDAFFIDGNSHETIPAFFHQYPQTYFDMITVDGDHTDEGAFDDLCNVIPFLSEGGVLVFDDIAHPAHPRLLSVWRKAMEKFPCLAGYEYIQAGYGVAFAIRTR